MPAPEIPDWVTFPEEEWIEISPVEAGLDVEQWKRFLAEAEIRGAAWEGEVHEGNEWGAALARGGYLVHVWGDRDYRFQTASLGKAFVWAVLGLAAGAGMVRPDDPIHRTWTGAGQLSHPHKHLDQGFHKNLTWRHILGPRDKYEHHGGFPVTNGFYWRQGSSGHSADTSGRQIPKWAKWTGDPSYDNYSHAEPGTVAIYSSGGLWRCAQALTALWKKDIKQVLDENLFGPMGIPADRWDWTPGKVVRETRDWYPHMPGYGDFLDPPYEIDGQTVRGGPGWVVMSPADLARFGHLIATRGNWKGDQLIDPRWLRNHAGGNGSFVGGESRNYTAVGWVTTWGISFPFPEDLFVGPVQVS